MFPCLMMNNSVYSPISYSELAPSHIHFFLIKGAAPSGSDYLVTGNRARGDMLKQITAFQLPVTKILYHVLEREAELHEWNLEP